MSDERNTAASDVATCTVQVGNPDGLHMRPITLVTQAASRYACSVSISKGETDADAKAMIQLLTLAAACGESVTVRAEGPGANEAVEEIAALISATSPD
ncbi:HPr family phosphocarrier protein [Alienimonas chondri]|uniref:HPr domain-containing protein n=1 Tax=Alienimonas chondri TaxID=2681879 RepID=A0ABX1VAE6_9PLAN|nr:HPr family phosphocarrier protein [Alienimonas chondri]NNJ24257.1 hypothetical protein [Alienimonas chondri]